MDAVKQLNRKAFWAGLIWAIPLHLIAQILVGGLGLAPGTPLQQVASGAAVFIAFLTYPLALSAVAQSKVPFCWRNLALHAAGGSFAALLGILLISSLAASLWLISGLLALMLWLLVEVTLPWLRSSGLLGLRQETERRKGTWKRLAQLSLWQVITLQFPTLR